MNGAHPSLLGGALALLVAAACSSGGSVTAAPIAKTPVPDPAPTGRVPPERGEPADGDTAPDLDEDEELPDDGADPYEEVSNEQGPDRPHPLDGWSDERVAEAVKDALPTLGSISVGSPSAGLLVNGVEAQECEWYVPVSPGGTWATEETLDYLERALRWVHAQIPDTPPLRLGDISAQKGGAITPHISHQSGRDVDISYFYVSGPTWYQRGRADNLDLPRNWAFVRALVTETDVELILIDQSIQNLIADHARSIGEDPDWIASIFRGSDGKRPLIRHARGHATHIHVRFFNPIAQETARRANAALVREHIVPPVQSYVHHRARRGDTLGKLAKRYGTTIVAIKKANRLKSSLIKERRTYLIPVAKPRSSPPAKRLTFPARRLPPPESAPKRAAGSALSTGSAP